MAGIATLSVQDLDDSEHLAACLATVCGLPEEDCLVALRECETQLLAIRAEFEQSPANMDETFEHDTSGGDLEGETDMEDGFDGYRDGAIDEWPDYLDDGGSFMMRRFLEHGIPTTQHFQAPRRRMTHSEAGSRRPSYSASIVSDMLSDEMDTVEEEDEEDVDDRDSSMNDFIDEGETEGGSYSTTSTPGQTPQPQSAPRLNRRPVESETSSNMSQVPEEGEEEGPIPNGLRRQQYQARLLSRANGSKRTASSTSTETSTEHDLDEDAQALLHAAGWSPLDYDGPEDGMDEDNDSDGGRTTVGWDATYDHLDQLQSTTPIARPRTSNRNPAVEQTLESPSIVSTNPFRRRRNN